MLQESFTVKYLLCYYCEQTLGRLFLCWKGGEIVRFLYKLWRPSRFEEGGSVEERQSSVLSPDAIDISFGQERASKAKALLQTVKEKFVRKTEDSGDVGSTEVCKFGPLVEAQSSPSTLCLSQYSGFSTGTAILERSTGWTEASLLWGLGGISTQSPANLSYLHHWDATKESMADQGVLEINSHVIQNNQQ